MRIDGIRHDDSGDYEGWQEQITFEHVEITNTSDDAIELEGTVLRYDESHRYSLPELTFEAGAVLTIVSRERGGNRLDRDPPIYFRGAGFEQPKTVLESPGTVTLLDGDGDRIDQEDY